MLDMWGRLYWYVEPCNAKGQFFIRFILVGKIYEKKVVHEIYMVCCKVVVLRTCLYKTISFNQTQYIDHDIICLAIVL